jgi:hypothetical protein
VYLSIPGIFQLFLGGYIVTTVFLPRFSVLNLSSRAGGCCSFPPLSYNKKAEKKDMFAVHQHQRTLPLPPPVAISHTPFPPPNGIGGEDYIVILPV